MSEQVAVGDNGERQPTEQRSGDLAGLIGAVVVNHEAGDALAGCVASLRENGLSSIVVVDNASADGSLETLARLDKTVTIVPTGKNLGYGRAANLGARRLTESHILVCNPDLVLEKGAVASMFAGLQASAEIALVGPQILNDDGSVYPSARALPSFGVALAHAFLAPVLPHNRWSRRYRVEDQPSDIARDTDWVSGACMLVRRLAFDSVGGFDEGYFMYVEDLDLCWRLGRAGWRVRYVPQARVLHAQGTSTARHPYRMQVAHHRSTWRYARRSMTGAQRALLPFVGAVLAARLVLMLAHEKAHR